MIIRPTPYIHADSIELDTAAELTRAGLFPSVQQPIVDIEAFLERHLGVQLDQYAELEADVLGVTEFFPDRQPHVRINRNLAEAADDYNAATWQRGRLRITLAHEAGHVLLHRRLFDFSTQQDTLWQDSAAVVDSNAAQCQRCLKRDLGVTNSRRADRREIQANLAMAALLMPKGIFEAMAILILTEWGIVDAVPRDEQDGLRARLTRELGERFQVSGQATEIRMQTLDVNRLLSQARLTAH